MKKWEKFFYIDTLYSLFICLLLENNLDKNFYFFSSKFPRIVMKNLRNKLIIKEIRSIKIVGYIVNAILFRIIKLFFYAKTKTKKFYIHDATDFTQYFFNNFNSIFISIEDGTLNYNSQFLNEKLKKANRKVNFSKKNKKKFCLWNKKNLSTFGSFGKSRKNYINWNFTNT